MAESNKQLMLSILQKQREKDDVVGIDLFVRSLNDCFGRAFITLLHFLPKITRRLLNPLPNKDMALVGLRSHLRR